MLRSFLTLLVATVVVACSKSPETRGTPLDQMEASSVGGEALTGEVVEHVAAPPYSYLRIRTARGEVWAAVNAAQVAKGSTVTVSSPMLMTKFESKSLNRTFDEIYFGSLAPTGDATASGGDPHAGAASTTAPFDVKVDKASGTDARTVAEAWAQAADGKSVTIRGKVVKYNGGVMGKNWIHLQDGSGDAAQGTNDITVTSMDVASVGETVTITGTVRTNRDFGSGYVYRVIVEDAKVEKK